jgi:predicted DNA binding CopG/RHH family protein
MTTVRVKINKKQDIPKISAKEIEKLKSVSDDDLDFSDIPLIDDSLFNEVELIESPKKRKKIISIRVEPKTLKSLQHNAEQRGLGYQTLINQILLAYVNHLRK